jgi:hypothetical protein
MTFPPFFFIYLHNQFQIILQHHTHAQNNRRNKRIAGNRPIPQRYISKTYRYYSKIHYGGRNMIKNTNHQEIIIYNTDDGKTSVSLMTRDGNVWLNQNHLAELFDTSVPNISMHISNILKENELDSNSVIKDYLTTAADTLRHGRIKTIRRTS